MKNSLLLTLLLVLHSFSYGEPTFNRIFDYGFESAKGLETFQTEEYLITFALAGQNINPHASILAFHNKDNGDIIKQYHINQDLNENLVFDKAQFLSDNIMIVSGRTHYYNPHGQYRNCIASIDLSTGEILEKTYLNNTDSSVFKIVDLQISKTTQSIFILGENILKDHYAIGEDLTSAKLVRIDNQLKIVFEKKYSIYHHDSIVKPYIEEFVLATSSRYNMSYIPNKLLIADDQIHFTGHFFSFPDYYTNFNYSYSTDFNGNIILSSPSVISPRRSSIQTNALWKTVALIKSKNKYLYLLDVKYFTVLKTVSRYFIEVIEPIGEYFISADTNLRGETSNRNWHTGEGVLSANNHLSYNDIILSNDENSLLLAGDRFHIKNQEKETGVYGSFISKIKLDSNVDSVGENLVWERNHYFFDHNHFYDFHHLNRLLVDDSQSIYAFGHIERKNKHTQKAWLLKLDENGCLNDDCMPVSAEIPEKYDFDFRCYPNPTSSFLNLSFKLPPNEQQARIDILNLNGQTLHAQTLGHAQAELQLDVHDYAPGIYLARLQLQDGTFEVVKFLVQ